MPSTNKTAFLLLNRWISSDCPKMSDFNADNQRVDDAVKAHCEDAQAHLTAAQKAWVASPVAAGSYAGNGDDNRFVTLGYRPALLLIFAAGYAPQEFDAESGSSVLRFGAAAAGGASSGVTLGETGFTVRQQSGDPLPGMAKLSFNESGVTYVYFAVK